MKETPGKFRWLKVHASQDMRKSTRNAATRKCLTIRCRLSAMFMFCSTAWAPRTSQLMSDQHSRSQMIVPIPKLRRTPTQGIACSSRRQRSLPDSNQQTPLRKCTSCASPSKQPPAHNVKSQPAIFTAKPIISAAGSICALQKADRGHISRQNK